MSHNICTFFLILLVIVDNCTSGIHVIHRTAVDYAAMEHCGLDETLSDNSCAVAISGGFGWQLKCSYTSSHIIAIVSFKKMSDKHLSKGKYILY
jgi:hypothetical protein